MGALFDNANAEHCAAVDGVTASIFGVFTLYDRDGLPDAARQLNSSLRLPKAFGRSNMNDYFLDVEDWPKSLPNAHRELLLNIINRLSSRPDLLGIAIGGSFISGQMDYYSDLDLVIVVDPKEWHTVEKTRIGIAESIGPLIIAFTGEHIGLPQMLICLYGTIPLHVDLKFIVPEQFTSRSEDPVILWDRNGTLHTILATSRASFPTIDWQWIEDRFWVWIHYMTSRVGRGELFAAIDFLSFIRERALGPIALQISSANPNGVRHIERDASKYAELMQSTLPRYE